jgi:hypothetical protein
MRGGGGGGERGDRERGGERGGERGPAQVPAGASTQLQIAVPPLAWLRAAAPTRIPPQQGRAGQQSVVHFSSAFDEEYPVGQIIDRRKLQQGTGGRIQVQQVTDSN